MLPETEAVMNWQDKKMTNRIWRIYGAAPLSQAYRSDEEKTDECCSGIRMRKKGVP